MPGADHFLYRGTSVGWPGTPGVQRVGITPATTDPLVATLFAIECSRHGSGVVYLARTALIANRIVSSNWFAELECEIGLRLTPLEFAQEFAGSQIQVGRAREILRKLDVEVPEVISNRRQLDRELERRQQLTDRQIVEFNEEALR